MAFNSGTITTRYSASGNVAVLKSDFTKIAADLTTMQTYMATASSNPGKFKALHLAEVTATPATSIPLHHLSVNGYAATGTAGAWKRVILAEVGVTPATNISLYHLNINGYGSTSFEGGWKQLRLDDTVVPGTNISIRHLKQVNSSFSVANAFSYVNDHNSESTSGITLKEKMRVIIPSTAHGDGGNNVQFYLVGQTTGYTTGVATSNLTLKVFVLMGSYCDATGTYHAPVFVYSGFNGTGSTVGITTTMVGYNIAAA